MSADLSKYQPREVGKPVQPEVQLCRIRYSPCGKFLAGGDFEGKVRLWDSSGESLTALAPLVGHQGWVQGLAFHPDGKTLFSGDSWGRLCTWAFQEKPSRPRRDIERAHDAWIRQLAVSSDGKYLASCSSDGIVRLWGCDNGAKHREWKHPHDVLALTFAPDNGSLLFGDLRGEIHRVDLTSGKSLRVYDARKMYRLDRIQDVGGVRCLAFAPGGKILVAGGCVPTSGGFVQGAGTLIFYEAESGKVVQSLDIGGTNDGFVYDVAWHRDGFVMAVLSGQPGTGKLIFHRPTDAQPFFVTPKMPNCHSLALHPGGSRVIVAATNSGSSGNGRPKTKDQSYPGNSSPLHRWDLPS